MDGSHTSGGRDLSIVNSELFGIEDEFTGWAGDLGVYLGFPIVSPGGPKLEVKEGQVIVSWFCPELVGYWLVLE